MFDVGFAELFLLSLIGLLVLGPERLPAVARTLGIFARKARNSWYNLKHSVETELAASDISEPLKSARNELQSVSRSVSDMGREMKQPPATGPGTASDAEPGTHLDDGAESAPTEAKGAAAEAEQAATDPAETAADEGEASSPEDRAAR